MTEPQFNNNLRMMRIYILNRDMYVLLRSKESLAIRRGGRI